MNSVFNVNLFRHVSVQTRGFNSLCTLIHQLNNEGEYFGEIYNADFLLGRFRVAYDKALENPQVNIDAATFDAVSKKGSDTKEMAEKKYRVGAEGYILFHTSGTHKELHVTLSEVQQKENNSKKVSFDSRKLGKGDLIVLRPFHPGAYSLVNIDGKQSTTFNIAEKERYAHPSKLSPLTITLQEEGFKMSKTEINAFQALIIQPEIICSLELKLQREKPARAKRAKVAD